eukprot:ANDGO_00027.mRNA.1 hypothetical protein
MNTDQMMHVGAVHEIEGTLKNLHISVGDTTSPPASAHSSPSIHPNSNFTSTRRCYNSPPSASSFQSPRFTARPSDMLGNQVVLQRRLSTSPPEALEELSQELMRRFEEFCKNPSGFSIESKLELFEELVAMQAITQPNSLPQIRDRITDRRQSNPLADNFVDHPQGY